MAFHRVYHEIQPKLGVHVELANPWSARAGMGITRTWACNIYNLGEVLQKTSNRNLIWVGLGYNYANPWNPRPKSSPNSIYVIFLDLCFQIKTKKKIILYMLLFIYYNSICTKIKSLQFGPKSNSSSSLNFNNKT